MLLPQDPTECFEFSAAALDLADRLQTPVFVMTDLDIGMNQRLCEPFALGRRTPLRPRQGDDAPRSSKPARTSAATRTSTATASPGARCPARTRRKGAYFTRGTTRDAYARYSEAGPDYIYNVQRLLKKFATAATLVPQPVVRAAAKKTRLGVLYFGSTAPAMDEALEALADAGIHLDAMRLRAFPFPHQRGRVHRRARPGLRRRAEPRRADAHAADQRARGRPGRA